MFGCRHHHCPGHADILEAILHIQEYIVSTVEQIQTDFTAYQADVTSALSDLQASVSDLQTTANDLRDQLAAALAQQGGIPTDVQAKLDELDGQITAADTALKAVPAQPTEPPADQPAA